MSTRKTKSLSSTSTINTYLMIRFSSRPEKVPDFCSRQQAGSNRFAFFNGYMRPCIFKFCGLSTQVKIGTHEGLKHESSIHCDELVSIPKMSLTHFIGSLSAEMLMELDVALKIAVGAE